MIVYALRSRPLRRRWRDLLHARTPPQRLASRNPLRRHGEDMAHGVTRLAAYVAATRTEGPAHARPE